MPFNKFVEVGRVVVINYGPDAGKLATIVDIVDGKKVLIDGPQNITGVHRQVILVKRINLTSLVAKVSRNASQKSLNKAFVEGDIMAKWEKSSWAQTLAKKAKRAANTDFDRFKVMVAKKQVAKLVAEKL